MKSVNIQIPSVKNLIYSHPLCRIWLQNSIKKTQHQTLETPEPPSDQSSAPLQNLFSRHHSPRNRSPGSNESNEFQNHDTEKL